MVWSVEQNTGLPPDRKTLETQLGFLASGPHNLFIVSPADRDKAHSDADAQHREDLAIAAAERQHLMGQQTSQLLALVQQNTELTTLTRELSERIEKLTAELHGKLVQGS